MPVYIVTDTSLTSVADAIRTKGGTSDLLEFPTEFVSAIENLPTGGSDDYVRSTVCPQQNFSNAGGGTYVLLTDALRLIDGDFYIITYDNIEYVCSSTELWGSDRFMGSIQLSWGATGSDLVFPFCIEDWNSNPGPAVYALDNSQHSIKIEHLELLTGGTTLVQKTITVNGTYDPEDDNADGYSGITVNVPSAAGNYQAKTGIVPTTQSQTITPDSGYDALSSVQIDAMPNGTATAPSSISGTSASVTTGTNTLTLTKSVSVTPDVTAGYVSSGTAGDSSVSLTASVITQAAQTIHPSASDQTIGSDTYLTGTQTVKGVTISGLEAGNIKSGVTVKVGDSSDDDCITSVTGTYTGGGSSKNIQTYIGTDEIISSSYTATDLTITVSKAGTYKCSWTGSRNTTSGTSGSQLYKNGSAVGSAHTTFTRSYWQQCEETLDLAVGDVLVVYARSRNTSYYMSVGNLVIAEQ